MKIEIKPFSVNGAWNTYCSKCRSARTVKRTQTTEYKAFAKSLMIMLPPIAIDFKKPLKIDVIFGFSSRASDIDNPLKPLIDVMQKKYNFNDNQIQELNVKKEYVKKGEEFISLNINEIK